MKVKIYSNIFEIVTVVSGIHDNFVSNEWQIVLANISHQGRVVDSNTYCFFNGSSHIVPLSAYYFEVVHCGSVPSSVGKEGHNMARARKEAKYIRVNNPILIRNIGKCDVPHIWDKVLFSISELKTKWMTSAPHYLFLMSIHNKIRIK